MNYKMSPPSSNTASKRSSHLSKGYSAVFATVFIWSLPSLFMFYLNRYYDPWAQNFYRYSVACIAIAPLLFYQIRRGAARIDMRAVKLCLLPCLPSIQDSLKGYGPSSAEGFYSRLEAFEPCNFLQKSAASIP